MKKRKDSDDSRIYKGIHSKDNALQSLVKPMRKKLDIEVLKREQNYQPVDKKVLHQKIEELDLRESAEQLSAM